MTDRQIEKENTQRQSKKESERVIREKKEKGEIGCRNCGYQNVAFYNWKMFIGKNE